MKHRIGKALLVPKAWLLNKWLPAAADVLAPPLLVAVALVAHARTVARRIRGKGPRLVWGPAPVISLKYWSEAMKRRGYDSATWVYGVTALHTSRDWDRRGERVARSPYLAKFNHHLYFAQALWRADIFFCFFEGSFLHHTNLRRRECQLLRLAGKRLVVSPYGGDIAVPGHLGAAEERLLQDYPIFLEIGDQIRERVDYFSRWADVIVRNYQYGYLPRGDVIWPTELAIDTDQWPERPPGDGDGRNGPVTVIHAPNHRRVKGTDVLLEVVDELRSEGLDIRLDLIEQRPNEEVREAMLAADIVADQFVAGYAMFAIEGMSAGKPVISTISVIAPEVLDTDAMRECPIVDADLDTLKTELRRLVEHPAERRRVGRASREFALAYHSLDAVGRGWEAILDHLWRGAPLPQKLPLPPGGERGARARTPAATMPS